MPLIGTAGHVDHGKSTLIQALSGRDPDRWAEEKERGLTIDLGFAWTDLGDGQETSFVDVPGHERYLKNMLAGIEAIDVALLVVAANEGWMPQTEEHLAVIDLLGITRGVVAVTKVDIVDDETAELATLEVEDQLRGTSLAGSSIVRVSSTTGSGIDKLRSELLNAVRGTSAGDGIRPRVWVDRAFTVAGAGTVVTGSMVGGHLLVGDRVFVYPSGSSARVRSLQSHEKEADRIDPGRRAAVGLSGIDLDRVSRGDLVTKDEWRVSDRFLAEYRLARYIEELPGKGSFQIHIGSRASNIQIVKASRERMIMSSTEALPLVMGERFIIRDTGRRMVVAGGRILDPKPRRSSFTYPYDVDRDPTDRANQLLNVRKKAPMSELVMDSDGGSPSIGVVANGIAVSDDLVSALVDRARATVRAEHVARPLRNGVALATLAESLDSHLELLEAVIEESGNLEIRGPDVSEISHRPSMTLEQEASWRATREALSGGLEVPSTEELGLPMDVLHFLIRTDELVPLTPSLVYLPEQITEIVATVGSLPSPFSVGDVKSALGLSRKYVVPILEWLDANQYTRRRGDSRVAGPRLGSG